MLTKLSCTLLLIGLVGHAVGQDKPKWKRLHQLPVYAWQCPKGQQLWAKEIVGSDANGPIRQWRRWDGQPFLLKDEKATAVCVKDAPYLVIKTMLECRESEECWSF